MTASDALPMLWKATLAISAAALLLMVLPAMLRRFSGAGVAYAAWLLLPAVLLACLLPAPTTPIALPVALPFAAASPAAAPLDVGPSLFERIDPLWWCAIWLAGALATACLLWRRQSAFERALGALRRVDGDLWEAPTASGLPALLGVLRMRIVLPVDFHARYTPRERTLMLAHERMHARRCDPLANLVAALFRCAFWFNPLVHLAARMFRRDQELACDQAVIALHPDSRRAYGEAMLKTLGAGRSAPLACHWGFPHPLKERIMQLASPSPRRRARRIGVVAVALLSMGAGFAVWSAQPRHAVASTSSAGADYLADLRLRIDEDAPISVRLGDRFGAPIRVTHHDARGAQVEVDGTVRPAANGAYDLALAIRRDGAEIAHPRLIVGRHAPGTVRVGEVAQDGAFHGVELTVDIDRAEVAADNARTEAAQAQAEAANAQAEASKAQAHAAREQAQAERQRAQAAREQAQAERIQGQEARAQAQEARVQAQEARVQAQEARLQAEKVAAEAEASGEHRGSAAEVDNQR